MVDTAMTATKPRSKEPGIDDSVDLIYKRIREIARSESRVPTIDKLTGSKLGVEPEEHYVYGIAI